MKGEKAERLFSCEIYAQCQKKIIYLSAQSLTMGESRAIEILRMHAFFSCCLGGVQRWRVISSRNNLFFFFFGGLGRHMLLFQS